MAKPIMIQGTCSNAGKSFVTASLCRLFHNMGYKVAPFKSQNMSRNFSVLENGDIISSAQVFQCKGAKSKPTKYNNPIMLIPNSDTGSKVVCLGKELGNMTAKEYFSVKAKFKKDIMEAYNALSKENDIIVIEGAGSPAEINLLDGDFVNMGLAEMVDSPVLLVGDIDRGGVFASLYGTVKLLPKAYQERIKGYIINKFRGDREILLPGIERLSSFIDVPCLGIIPYLDVSFEEEDSLSKEDGLKPKENSQEFFDCQLEKASAFINEKIDINAVFRIMGIK